MPLDACLASSPSNHGRKCGLSGSSVQVWADDFRVEEDIARAAHVAHCEDLAQDEAVEREKRAGLAQASVKTHHHSQPTGCSHGLDGAGCRLCCGEVASTGLANFDLLQVQALQRLVQAERSSKSSSASVANVIARQPQDHQAVVVCEARSKRLGTAIPDSVADEP